MQSKKALLSVNNIIYVTAVYIILYKKYFLFYMNIKHCF